MLDVIVSDAYARWFDGLKDKKDAVRIDGLVTRIRHAGQYVGDWKPVGGGVIESRLFFGSGYRIYSYIDGKKLLLLLAGGNKASQKWDITRAKSILIDWRRTNDGNVH